MKRSISVNFGYYRQGAKLSSESSIEITKLRRPARSITQGRQVDYADRGGVAPGGGKTARPAGVVSGRVSAGDARRARLRRMSV